MTEAINERLNRARHLTSPLPHPQLVWVAMQVLSPISFSVGPLDEAISRTVYKTIQYTMTIRGQERGTLNMAQDTVKTFEEFVSKFPVGGTATANFNAAEGSQQIGFQVKQPNGRHLTYVQRFDKQSHSVIKRLAESYIAKLNASNLNHDRLIDDTPEKEE